MSRRFSILNKKRKILFFIALNVTLFLLYTQSLNRPNYVLEEMLSVFSKSVAETQSELLAYLKLKDINYSLRQENTRLRNLVDQNFLTSYLDSTGMYRSRILLSDIDTASLRGLLVEKSYKWMQANLIQRIHKAGKIYLVINIGSKHGVRNGMLVTGVQGVVGQVVKVYNSSAVVMTLFHENFRIASKVNKNGSTGILLWEGVISSDLLLLRNIPSTDYVWVGDTVYSSHISSIAPPNIPIGRVVNVDYETRELFSLSVQPIEQLSKLYSVYVIMQLENETQELVQQAIEQLP